MDTLSERAIAAHREAQEAAQRKDDERHKELRDGPTPKPPKLPDGYSEKDRSEWSNRKERRIYERGMRCRSKNPPGGERSV